MDERTGGHHFDTGDGPTRPDAPEPPLSAGDAAWREYIVHRAGCSQCRTHTIRCGEGDRLWNGYTVIPRG